MAATIPMNMKGRLKKHVLPFERALMSVLIGAGDHKLPPAPAAQDAPAEPGEGDAGIPLCPRPLVGGGGVPATWSRADRRPR